MFGNLPQINIPKSPLTKEETDYLNYVIGLIPQIEAHIADMKRAGLDISEGEKAFKDYKEKLLKIQAVYGKKYG